MSTSILVDTNVLVDYLRGYDPAKKFLEAGHDPMFISAITVAELYAGVRNKNERKIISEFISIFEIISVSEIIAVQGGLYRKEYGKSHGAGLADCLIAASAQFVKAQFVTLNKKHFPMLKNVLVPY